MIKPLLRLAVFTALSLTCFGQKLVLKNAKNDKQISLEKGMRVGYFIHAKNNIQTGLIYDYSSTSITIDSIRYNFNELKSIGPRKKHTVLKVIGLVCTSSIISGISLGAMETSSSKALPILGLTSGLSLFALCELVTVKNQPKKLRKKWVLVFTEKE